MAEEKEPWLNWLALTTVVLAVCATLATFKGGGFSTRSMMSQARASDQWAFYQAKSLKGYIYQMQKERLELELMGMGGRSSRAGAYRKKIEEYGKKVAKYEGDKAAIQKEAKGFEAVRDDAQKHSQAFGIAVIFLQIAILLSSIAALLKKRYVWVIGVAVGVVGIVSFVNGFLLLF